MARLAPSGLIWVVALTDMRLCTRLVSSVS
jgi:hypothetical protein